MRLESRQLVGDVQLIRFLKRAVPVLIGIYVFFNPFPHTTSIKEICFYGSVLAVVVLVLCRKATIDFKTPLSIPFGLFGFWALLSIFFALDVKNSVHDFYSHLIRYYVLYFVLINFFGSEKRLFVLSWVIIASATTFSMGALFYHYVFLEGSQRFGHAFTEICVNTIGVVTLFAINLSLHLFVSDSRFWCRAGVIFCLFPLVAATLGTQSRGTFIAFCVSMFVLFWRKKIVLVTTLVVLVLIGLATPLKTRFLRQSTFKNERITTYCIALEILKEYPVVGIGFGMESFGQKIDLNDYFERIPDKCKTRNIFVDPHNMLLSVAVRTGYVGLGLFCFVIWTFLVMCWKGVRNNRDEFVGSWSQCTLAVFAGYLVIGLLEPVFSHVPETVFYSVLSMGTIVWSLNNKKISHNEQISERPK